jgi:CDP-diacylglycerol---serine O-phosphatidyltransferase
MKPHLMRKHLPNFLTCMNLLSGCMAIVMVFQGQPYYSALLVAASLVFDFLDGFAARMLKSTSPLGQQLDSLADMVTFGLLPGVVMHRLFLQSVPFSLEQDPYQVNFLSFFPFIITVFSALRLAVFNLDERQAVSFRGLPTPACTIFVVSLALIPGHDRFHLTPVILNSYFIAGVCMILSYLLVSGLPLFALKFRNFSWKQNQVQYIFLVLSLVLILAFGYTGLPLIILLYIILSLINHLLSQKAYPSST